MKFTDRFFFFSLSVLVAAGIWAVWPIDPPITYTAGDTVWPTTVKVGATIMVTRSFTVTREGPVTIVRTFVKGDCAVSCETVDLPASTVTLKIGEHRVQTREFSLPASIEPGLWRVVFVAQWQDRIGRTQRLPLKELPFTVTP